MSGYARLEKTVTVTVDSRDSSIVRNGSVVGSNANHLPLGHMSIVHSQEATSIASLEQQPEIGPGSETSAGDIAQAPSLQVRNDKVRGQQSQQCVAAVRRDQIGDHFVSLSREKKNSEDVVEISV